MLKTETKGKHKTFSGTQYTDCKIIQKNAAQNNDIHCIYLYIRKMLIFIVKAYNKHVN